MSDNPETKWTLRLGIIWGINRFVKLYPDKKHYPYLNNHEFPVEREFNKRKRILVPMKDYKLHEFKKNIKKISNDIFLRHQ